MGDAKFIRIRPISSSLSRRFIETHHYSGKSQSNAVLHFGVYWQNSLEGVMMFGSPMVRQKALAAFPGLHWNGLLEINRMVFTDKLPRNSESRALGFALRLLRKKRPDIKVVISFSDATRCGDGTIYRAAGFLLTQIKENTAIWRLSNGECLATIAIASGQALRRRLMAEYNIKDAGQSSNTLFRLMGGVPLVGHQLRYVFFLDKSFKENCKMHILPYSAIADAGAGMYKGVKRATSIGADASTFQVEEGGSRPTVALQNDTVSKGMEKAGGADA